MTAMNAYPEYYLDDAMINLGDALDYSVNSLKMSPNVFTDLLLASGYAVELELGSPAVICGMSGVDLALHICRRTEYPIPEYPHPIPDICYERSPEYWAGWILAYTQWKLTCRYQDLLSCLSADDVIAMYTPFHEAPEDHFVQVISQQMQARKTVNRLQEYRKRMGYTQRELADISGINLRTLQQYETGAKRLNKSAGDQLLHLARVLGCSAEALIS